MYWLLKVKSDVIESGIETNLCDNHSCSLISEMLHGRFHVDLFHSFTYSTERHVQENECSCPTEAVWKVNVNILV
jgi:hypothetical protein